MSVILPLYCFILAYFRRSPSAPSRVILYEILCVIYYIYILLCAACISHTSLLFRIGVIGRFTQRNAPTKIILNFLHTLYTHCSRTFYCKHCIYTKITQYNNIIMAVAMPYNTYSYNNIWVLYYIYYALCCVFDFKRTASAANSPH